jgi:hypothetical protein
MKATFSKKFQKPTLGQNVRIKIPDIGRAKINPKSIIAVFLDITDEEFYEPGTKLGKLKALYTRNQFTLCKEHFLSMEEVGKEEISVREVVNKLYLFGGQKLKKCNCSKKCTTNMCCANQSIYFVTPNVTTVKLAVTSKFNYDLIILKKIVINKLLLFHEHFLIMH